VDEIGKQIHRAQRRRSLQRFVGSLGWACSATLSVSVVLVLAGIFWLPGVSPWIWVAGGVALGIVAAWAWTMATAGELIDAAIEIDRRFGLKERVSSAWALAETDRRSQAGQALVDDAARRVGRIDISDRMKVTPSRRLLYPLVPAAIVLLVMVLFGPAENTGAAQARADQAQVRKQLKTSTKKLERELLRQRKKAQKEGLKEIDDVLKLLQQDIKKLREQSLSNRKKALTKLNDWARQLKEQRDKSAAADKLQDRFRQLRNLRQGPADRLAKAMKQGDFNKAMEELGKLGEELSSGELDEKQRQQLTQQLDQMAQKLGKIAEAHRQTQQKLEEQIEKLRDAGQLGQANKLEEQLAKLREQLPQMDVLDKLAGQLKECSECCKEGQMGEAQQAMKQLADNLGQLQQESDQLAMLDETLDQIAQCRSEMCCPECEGAGCKACQGQQAGGGLEAGKGHVPGGSRAKEPDVAFHDSRVPQKVTKGPMAIVQYVEGPHRRQEADKIIKDQLEAARHSQTDPLTDQHIPRKHRRHTQEYLDRFRQGQ